MAFLDEARKKLDLSPAEEEQVMRELESHYREIKDELMKTGMDESDADLEAARRFGDPTDIVHKMQNVHCRVTWKTALLSALPFLGFACMKTLLVIVFRLNTDHWIELSSILAVVGICSAFVIGSIRELKAERRPLWLASWLPGGIMILSSLIFMAARMYLNAGISENGALSERAVIVEPLQNSIELLLLGLMAVWAYRQSVKWKFITIGIMVLGLIINILITQITNTNPGYFIYLPQLVRGLFDAALIILLAIKLFLEHPYGNLIQSGLMLFTFTMFFFG